MSVQAITWALDQRVRSATHKAVLLVLANRMDPTGFGWPSQKRVAKEANCCERTARKVIRDLEEDGILLRDERRRKDGSFTTDSVQFAMPLPPAADIADGPAADLTDGKSCRRQDTTAPAANPAGLTTFEPNTKNRKKVKATQAPPPNLPEAIASYDQAAERRGWVRLKAFTEDRRAKARDAWRRIGGADGWHALIAEAERQSFLGGANDRGWRMDFDFFISKRGATHIIEGKYLTPDERKASGNSPDDIAARRIIAAKKHGHWPADKWGEPPAEVLPFLKAQGART
jgi:hypothetical protein